VLLDNFVSSSTRLDEEEQVRFLITAAFFERSGFAESEKCWPRPGMCTGRRWLSLSEGLDVCWRKRECWLGVTGRAGGGAAAGAADAEPA
jgi:hypothetical protein